MEDLKNRFFTVTTRIIAERMRDKDPMVRYLKEPAIEPLPLKRAA